MNNNTSTRQPMRFGEILDTTFNLYRKHFLLFLGIISLDFCGRLVGCLIWRLLPGFPLRDIVIDLINMPFKLVSMGGIIIAVATIYLSGRITSRDALKQAGHQFWQLLVCALVWSFVFVIPRAVDLFPIFYYVGYVESVEGYLEPVKGRTDPILLRLNLTIFIRLVSLPFSIDLPMHWESITSGLIPWVTRRGPIWIGLIPSVLAPFSIYFAVRWMFAITAVLLEKPLIRSAFERSSELTRGRWWWVWSLLVSCSVLSSAILLIVVGMIGFIYILTTGETMPTNILEWTVMYGIGSSNPLYSEIMVWINIIISTLIFPIWVIGITLLYLDLWIRKEESNVEYR